MNVTEFGSTTPSRLWIINPRQKESRERPQSPRNTTEAQYRKCINRIEFKLEKGLLPSLLASFHIFVIEFRAMTH